MLTKRSIRLSGHATSLALEDEFWQALDALATADGHTTTALIAAIDRNRDANATNLGSAVRVYVLTRFRAMAAAIPLNE